VTATTAATANELKATTLADVSVGAGTLVATVGDMVALEGVEVAPVVEGALAGVGTLEIEVVSDVGEPEVGTTGDGGVEVVSGAGAVEVAVVAGSGAVEVVTGAGAVEVVISGTGAVEVEPGPGAGAVEVEIAGAGLLAVVEAELGSTDDEVSGTGAVAAGESIEDVLVVAGDGIDFGVGVNVLQLGDTATAK